MEIKQIVEEAPKFLAEFYDITEQEAKEKIEIGSKLVNAEFDEYGVTHAEFYSLVKNYPFDLAKFNSVRRVSFIVDIINAVVNEEVPTIENNWPDRKLKLLEFGGGGGELSLALSDDYEVTHVDVPGTTFDYAKFRAEKYGANIRFCHEIPDEKFDIVSMQDVYEHIKEIGETMHAVCDVMVPEGLFISSAYWYNSNHYLHLHQDQVSREHMTVAFANAYTLWLTVVFDDMGIKGKEAKAGIGAFRYKPKWNMRLKEHNILMSPQISSVLLPDIDVIPNAYTISRVTYTITIP